MRDDKRARARAVKGLTPFVIVLVLIAAYFGLADPYALTGENLLTASDFEDPTWERTMPPGWRGLGELSRWGAALGYGGSAGLEVRAGAERGGRVEWILDEPTRFSHVRVRGRLRVEGVEPGKHPWNLARLVFFCRDPSGRSRWDYPHTVAYLRGTKDWRLYEATLEVPPDVRSGHLIVQQAGRAGRVFVDDLELVPARFKASVVPLRRTLALLWAGTFLVALATLAPWRRPGGIVATLVTLVIVAGVAAPASIFSELVKWQRSLSVDARETIPDARSAAESGESAAADPSRPAPPPKTDPRASSAKRAKPGPPASEPAQVTNAVRDMKKHGHALLFGLLGLSAGLSYLWRRSAALALPLAGSLALFAASTELLQFMIAKRQPTWLDLGIDLAGLAIGVGLAWTALVALDKKKTGEGPRTSP